MDRPVYVIEHLDEELFPWSRCEYASIAKFISPSRLCVTSANFARPQEWAELENASLVQQSICEMDVARENVCLLDSESREVLQPEDAAKFTHFLFGGILGNTDEFDFDRTSVLREKGFPTRNLGSVQMTTDTAMRTTKRIVEDKVPFDQLVFVDRPEISSSEHEKLILNFRFLADAQGEPIIADGIIDILTAEGDFDLTRLE